VAKPWVSSVKDTGQLTIYNNLSSGKWVHIFKVALQSFNELSKRYGLGVTMSQAKEESEANVVMGVASGVAVYEYDGTKLSHPFDGKSLHGYTMLISREGQRGMEKAVVFLPSDPQTSAGFIGGKEVFEKANLDMMKVIAVHELIHACGLENSDHADDGLFCFRITPTGNGKVKAWGQEDDRAMPPLFLSQSTVGKVASLW
jgi:hypothetical protein